MTRESSGGAICEGLYWCSELEEMCGLKVKDVVGIAKKIKSRMIGVSSTPKESGKKRGTKRNKENISSTLLSPTL